MFVLCWSDSITIVIIMQLNWLELLFVDSIFMMLRLRYRWSKRREQHTLVSVPHQVGLIQKL